MKNQNSSEMKKILIADDHSLILDGIQSILSKSLAGNLITTLTTGKSVCEEAKVQEYDIYILDLEFKDMLGFDIIKEIRSVHADAKIIVNTMHEEVWNIERLINMEVNGIVLKSSACEHLEEAIKRVLDGEEYFCPRFSYLRTRTTSYRRSLKSKISQPSPQELIVLKYIVNGYTTQDIANELSLSVNTIESHRKSLFIKLEAKNMAHLVTIAIKQGLVE